MATDSALAGRAAYEFDELYVVSDFHLGGQAGRHLFGAAREFKALVDELVLRLPDGQVGLLINGDFVDFLAESSATQTPSHFDPDGALDTLRTIMATPEFEPVWSSLRAFVRVRGRSLIVNGGNHDLELALPWVREALCDRIAGADSAARGRLHLASDGAGVLCRVAGATVLCVHGNDVDPWNSVDAGRLARLTRSLLRGQPAARWVPNAGSRVVIEVVNPLKRHFLFVDLLKPEGLAILEFLHALGARLGGAVGGLTAAFEMKVEHQARMAAGLLGAEDAGAHGFGPHVESQPTPAGEASRDLDSPRWKAEFAQALQASTEERFRQGLTAMDLVAADERERPLGGLVENAATVLRSAWGAIGSHARGEEPAEVLRHALRFLVKDRSFALHEPDDTFRALSRDTGEGIDIVVAGHTHLERALPRPGGYYYNSGTWARLVQIDPQDLADGQRFKRIFEALQATNMKALDDSAVAISRPCVVAIVDHGDAVHAELRHVSLKRHAGSVQRAVDGTQFIKPKRA